MSENTLDECIAHMESRLPIDEHLCRMHAAILAHLRSIPALTAERDAAMRALGPLVCEGCGTTKSVAEIRAEHPRALSCCPERKMMPPALAEARNRAAQAEAERDELTARVAELEGARDKLREALRAATGYLLNAKIDLETGARKQTAINTIEGGLKMTRRALEEQNDE